MNTQVKDVRKIVQDLTPIPPDWSAKVVINDDNMTYVAWNLEAREALVVDPVREDLEILAHFKQELAGFRWIGVIDTHTHADHVSCAATLAQRLGAPLIQHFQSPSQRVHLRVSIDTTLPTRAGRLDLLLTPGHTPDSLSCLWGPFLFVGDLLLYADAGRDDLPGGNPEAHWESLQKLKKVVWEDVLFLPGHDGAGGRASSWKTQLEINSALSQEKTTFLLETASWTGPPPRLLKEALFENMK